MSRTLSLNMRAALNAEYSGEVLVTLFTITHSEFDGILRLSSDPTTLITNTPYVRGTISNGQTFLFFPMSVTLPDDVDQRAPQATLDVDNVSQELVGQIRRITTPGLCDIDLVLASAPNTIEISYPTLDIQSFQITPFTISIQFGDDGLDQEQFPAGIFAPYGFPGLF